MQIRDAVGYDERIQQLESNIYVITELIEEYIYTYLYIEAGELAEVQQKINIVIIVELLAAGILMLLLIRRTARKTRSITASITAPIDALRPFCAMRAFTRSTSASNDASSFSKP